MKNKIPFLCMLCLLSGCDESFIDAVKAEPVLNYSAMTYGEVLDKRKLCTRVDWSSEKIRNTPTVHYRCTLPVEEGIQRVETISWEKSRAMNGYVIINQTLEQTLRDGKVNIIALDSQRLLYGAVYDLITLEKYLHLHSLQ